mgnify:FL=1
MEIKGKVFIVTGGASGLGEGTARMLALRGGTVVIADMQVEKAKPSPRKSVELLCAAMSAMKPMHRQWSTKQYRWAN